MPIKEYLAIFTYRVDGQRYIWQCGCSESDTVKSLMAHYNDHKGIKWEFVSLEIEEQK